MDTEPRNMDLWMETRLNSWAEQGRLSADKSMHLQTMIAELAHQERKNRIFRTIYRLVATIIAYLWLLFARSPVAAAAYKSSSLESSPDLSINAVVLLAVLIVWGLAYGIQSQGSNLNLEVKYE